MASLATVADVETLLGTTVNGAQAQMVLDMVSAEIRTYCGWSISAETNVTTGFVGDGTRGLLLPTLKLTGIDSVVSDGDTLVADDDYRFTANGVVYRPWGRWALGAVIVVQYDHGWTPVPDDIRMVCLSAAVRQISNPGQVRSKSVEEYAVSYVVPASGQPLGMGLSDSDLAVLDRYALFRRP